MLVALLALAAPAAAQVGRDTLSLPALVVTATRVPGGIKTQTSTVTVLDGERLRAEGITHLGDALRRVPGLAIVRQSSFGSQSSLFLRGGQANYVRLLVDGVPVNEPGGTLDLGRITLDDIERIEVVRGPASVLYGSEAVTGVIQLFTRSGEKNGATRVNAELGGGSFDARTATLGASATSGGLAWALTGAHHASDGALAFNNAYRNDGLSASVALPSDDDRRFDARLSARYHASVYEYPTESDGTVGDRNAERTEHRAQAAFDAGHKWSDRLETRVQLSLSELHPRTTDGPDDAADTLGFFGYIARATVTRRQADLRTTYQVRTGQRITIGAEFARDAERGSSVSLSEFGDFPDEFRAARENLAVYLQGLGDAGRWSYTVGGRFDDNSAFGSFRTARAGLAYRVTDAVRFRASAGTAFKAPSFFENFASGFTVGNPALRPEQSQSAEFGIEATLASRVSLRATGFSQRFTDLVQYTGAPPAAGEPNYYNVAAANAGGVELEVAADVLGVSVAAAHTWTDTRVVDAGFDTGASANFVAGGRLLRRPEHVTTLSLSRHFSEAGTVNVTAIRTGEREDRDFSSFPAGVVFLEPFTTIDVGGELRLPSAMLPGASLQLRAENLADARYEQVFGFRTPGRTLYAGLKFRR